MVAALALTPDRCGIGPQRGPAARFEQPVGGFGRGGIGREGKDTDSALSSIGGQAEKVEETSEFFGSASASKRRVFTYHEATCRKLVNNGNLRERAVAVACSSDGTDCKK